MHLITGKHGWVSHNEVTSTTVAPFTYMYIISTLAIGHHGGCANPNTVAQLWEKPSVAATSGSALQLKIFLQLSRETGCKQVHLQWTPGLML